MITLVLAATGARCGSGDGTHPQVARIYPGHIICWTGDALGILTDDQPIRMPDRIELLRAGPCYKFVNR